MGMTPIALGASVPLSLLLEDGDTGKFPQAEIRNSAGTLLSTLDLAHVASGAYTNPSYVMPNETWIAVTFIVYNEAGHSTESSTHLRAQDVFVFLAAGSGTAAQIATAVWQRSVDDAEFAFPAAGRMLNRVFRYGTLPRRLNLTNQKLEIGSDAAFTTIVQSWAVETISGGPQLVIDQFGSPAVRLAPDTAF